VMPFWCRVGIKEKQMNNKNKLFTRKNAGSTPAASTNDFKRLENKSGTVIVPCTDGSYDSAYSHDDFFGNRKWINEVYVRKLFRKSGLPKASRLLDVGCGQGHFSFLFSKSVNLVLGIDLNKTGVRDANQLYGCEGLYFAVSDALAIPGNQFDCVFARSLSLYNTLDVGRIRTVTKELMDRVQSGGLLIFSYNANFKKKKQKATWRVHTLREIRSYFAEYPSEAYFTSKIDCLLFGRFGFNRGFSYLNMLASRLLGLGGEMVCFVRKSPVG
jgi:SAM-dependent methyltransferase